MRISGFPGPVALLGLVLLAAVAVVSSSGCALERAEAIQRPILDPESLSDRQVMELLVYFDACQEWESRGGIGPPPEPPEWLKIYLATKPEAESTPGEIVQPDPVAKWAAENPPPPAIPEIKQATTAPGVCAPGDPACANGACGVGKFRRGRRR